MRVGGAPRLDAKQARRLQDPSLPDVQDPLKPSVLRSTKSPVRTAVQCSWDPLTMLPAFAKRPFPSSLPVPSSASLDCGFLAACPIGGSHCTHITGCLPLLLPLLR